MQGHPNAFYSLALIVGIFGGACASTTTVHTKPRGAEVYLNGERCGASPCIFHTRYGFPDRMRVQIFKPGYRSLEFFVDSEAPMASYLLLGFGSYVFHTFDEEYRFELTPEENSENSMALNQAGAIGRLPEDEKIVTNAIRQCYFWQHYVAAKEREKIFIERAIEQDCARAVQWTRQLLKSRDVAGLGPALAAEIIKLVKILPETFGAQNLFASPAELSALCPIAVVDFARQGHEKIAPLELKYFQEICPEQYALLFVE